MNNLTNVVLILLFLGFSLILVWSITHDTPETIKLTEDHKVILNSRLCLQNVTYKVPINYEGEIRIKYQMEGATRCFCGDLNILFENNTDLTSPEFSHADYKAISEEDNLSCFSYARGVN